VRAGFRPNVEEVASAECPIGAGSTRPSERSGGAANLARTWGTRYYARGMDSEALAPSVAGGMAKSPGKWSVFCVVAIGVLMATLDSSIVNISLPTMARSFGRPVSGPLQWVVIAYLLVIVALLLTGGRLGDMFGRKPIWQIGLGMFTVGSVLCGLSPSIGALIGFRALQGVGAALLMALSPALLTSAFPPEERGRALGMNALTVAVGVSAGPPLGGIITERLSWRWIFFINVPLGVIGILLAAFVLQRPAARGSARFDVGGAALLALALASFTGALSFAHDFGYTSPIIIGALLVCGVSLWGLVAHESRVAAPILDLELFRNGAFRTALATLVLSFLALFGVAFLTPFYLEELRHLSTEQSGLMMLAYPLMIAILAPLTGALSDRIGTRLLSSLGLGVASVALALLGGVGQSTSLVWVALYLALGGVGQALFQPSNNSALLGSAPRERQGLAGGVLATGRVLGQSLSIALSGAIFAGFGGAEAGRRLMGGSSGVSAELVASFLRGYRAALWVSAGLALLGALIAWRGGRSRLRSPERAA
jgi:EmrB/QacA subfamily drug resistance transporter